MKLKKDKSFFTRLCVLITCILMLAVIAIVKDGSVMGYEIMNKSKAEVCSDTATVSTLDDGTIVVNSTNLASDVRGYAGPVPMKVYIKGGLVDSIEVLKNSETPEFLDGVKEEIITKYIGKSVQEARSLNVDVVSGATYSSRAVKENLKRSLALVPNVKDGIGSSADGSDGLTLPLILASIVALCSAIVPLFHKSKVYRYIQLALNVIVLGLFAGTFVSYSSVTGLLAHGINLQNLSLIILLVIAFIFPLFGKKGYYCAWTCPLGSAQELVGKTNKKKIKLGPVWTKRLNSFQKILWACLMLLAWTGICLEWMDYELFTAFLWQSASWIVIALAILVLILSAFISRPYCRFVCPTGVILKSL